MPTSWYSFDEARTIGQRGSEGGTTLRDEEHSLGSRITLERGGPVPYAITCGIYGWMFHTRFFSTEVEANEELDKMKSALERILLLIPGAADPEHDSKAQAVSEQIAIFVEKFP